MMIAEEEKKHRSKSAMHMFPQMEEEGADESRTADDEVGMVCEKKKKEFEAKRSRKSTLCFASPLRRLIS